MEAFFGALGSYRRTLGAAMSGNVQGAIFRAQSRHYDSTLQAALDGPNVPTSVYKALVDSVNQHLPSFQRYLKLRKRILKLDELHYYDLYSPLVNDVPLSYTVEQAQANVKAAMAPLGADYVAGLDKAFHDRWIDYYPMTGKQSGAYMSPGAYDVHPYLLLNYNGQYTDMSAMAHELGHAMHSYFSGKNQPYATYNYPLFVAEVASTFNEALLIDHMLKEITDPKVKLALLGNYLENVKGTVFRQTQFAEFEMRMHEMAEAGQPITGDALSKLYLDITRKYYGHDAKICIVDDYVAQRVGVHPALLQLVLRLPVRDVVHGVDRALGESALGRAGRGRALPRVPGVRRVEVPDRSAEGRRRRHDDERAARPDDPEDGSRHGRDREAAQLTCGLRIAGCRL